MSGVEAINFQQVECGRKVAESKKRFRWKFQINDKCYTMQLANSPLSGKRIVTLNSVQIYKEQSILNINFDFSHVIEGHTFRITRIPDTLNKFELRIDTNSFDDILKNKKLGSEKTISSNQYKKQSFDPFAQFGDIAKHSNPEAKNNDFQVFDFDSFKEVPKKANVQPKPQTKSTADFRQFDFSAPQKPKQTPVYEPVSFQTNNFQTNAFGDFVKNFNKVDKEVPDQSDFATNTFGKNNLYNDLVMQKPQQKSDWSDFGKPQTEEKQSSFKIEMSAKQMLNKVKKTAAELKMKVTGQDESLI